MLMFSLDHDQLFAQGLADALDVTLSPHEERVFPDGERKLRPLVDPRGGDAYVVHSLHGGPVDSPHDKLCRLLMFIATLKDHGAVRVTAVVPYLAYARKDQQTKMHDPVSLRYVAQLFDAVGVAQLIVLEAHNVAAFQNAFRCTTVHLSAHHAFDALAHEIAGTRPLAVVSPDPGGVKRVLVWREALEDQLRRSVGFAMIDKRRSAGVLGGGHLVAGDVEGATVLLLDDLIASGETMQRSAAALRRAGAKEVIGCAAQWPVRRQGAGSAGGRQPVATGGHRQRAVIPAAHRRAGAQQASCRVGGASVRRSHPHEPCGLVAMIFGPRRCPYGASIASRAVAACRK